MTHGPPDGVRSELQVPNPPAAATGTDLTRFNALRHGVLSRYAVLPWEDAGAYDALLAALAAEHAPQGPTEEHLVEELAGILWRKRRLRLAEAAAFRHGLKNTFASFRGTVDAALAPLGVENATEKVRHAIRATEAATAAASRDLADDEAKTRRALDLLATTQPDRYAAALAGLRDDTRAWWQATLARDPDDLEDGEDPARADPDGLRAFLTDTVMPWYAARRIELAYRPAIRDQAFGEALDADKLERLARYEVHLDRKLERMLAMLVRLKELRTGAVPGPG
jgi:hypothetical protein